MIKDENSEKIRERLLSIIDSDFESDVSFEREMDLPPKTVNNWRRGRSASYMRLIPRLAERLDINVSELFDIPIGRDTSELSEDEIQLLTLYRKSQALPQKLRRALSETLASTIDLYLKTASELKAHEKQRRKNVK